MPNPISADDLLVLLEVARTGRLVAAARRLGVNHTTVSRRLAALERAVGARVLVQERDGWALTEVGQDVMRAAEDVEAALARLAHPEGQEGLSGRVRVATPDGFGVHHAVPALTELAQRHPGLDWELVTATQRLRQARAGIDIEIVIGRPDVARASAIPILRYELALYATPEYLAARGTPGTLDDLADHRLCYYIESALQVDQLDMATRGLPAPKGSLRSTSVFVHVEATARSGGIGILPRFLADDDERLVRVLPERYAYTLTYWAVVREETMRNPAVLAVLDALRRVGRGTFDAG